MAKTLENLAAVYDKLRHYGLRESTSRTLRRVRFTARALLDLDERLSARMARSVTVYAPSPQISTSETSAPELTPEEKDALCATTLALAEPWSRHAARPPDWSLDENSGKRLPNRHFRHIRFATNDDSGERLGDFMFPNELNKHGWVPLLALAWHLTDDPHWLDALDALLQSWRKTFRVGWGVPYLTTLNVGQRLLNWSMAARLINGTDEREVRLRKFLAREGYREALFLETYNTSYYERPNNYLFCESAAPLAFFATFPDLPRADARRALWREVLASACNDQIDSDGFTLEGSLAYSRFIAEILCLAVAFGETSVLSPLARLTRALSKLAANDGSIPSFGDISTERALDLGVWEDMRDSRTFFALASYLLDEHLERGPGGTDVELYLATGIASRPSGKPSTIGDIVFGTGGYAVADRPWGHIVVDMADLGLLGFGGHGHCDVGSFCIDDEAGALVVDPGTLYYSADREIRNLYRSSAMHNLTRIDDGEMAILSNELFRMFMTPRVQYESTLSDGILSLHIRHEGFLLGTDRVPVLRTLEIGSDGITVADSWESDMPAVSALHFAPGRHLRRSGSDLVVETPDGPDWWLVPGDSGLDMEISEYLFSNRYARGVPAEKLLLRPQAPVRALSYCLSPDTCYTLGESE